MAYNCIVLIREVWDTRDLTVAVLDEKNQVNEKALATRFEPEDLNALEMALKLKEANGGKVTALAFAEPRSVDVLRECLYRDATEVIRIGNAGVDKPDTATLAALFAAAAKKIGDYNLVLAGISICEGENSLLATAVAAQLGIDPVSYVDSIESAGPDSITVKREINMGREIVEAKLPALLVVGVALLKDDPRTPRSAKAMLKLKHKKTPIPSWSAADLGVDVAALKTTEIAGYENIPQRVIESKSVDAKDEAALRAMLAEIRKGA